MKKLFISLLAIAATMNVMALNIENQAKITITGGTASHSLYLINSSDLAEGFNNGYCGEIYQMDDYAVALYAIFDGKNYETFGSKNLMDQPIQFAIKTNGSETYTLKVEKVKGEPMVIAFGEKKITLAEGEYTLTAAEAAQPGEFYKIPYLLIGNKLTIGEVEDGAVINLQYFTYDNGKRVLGDPETSTEKVIELSTAKGYCEISYTNKAGVARKFIVNPAPVVTPAN